MGLKRFDRKFGKEYLKHVPAAPGVYRFYADDGRLIYVGKAKNLRRRLAQYRNARREKRGKKMRSLVARAVSIEWEICDTELDASLREIRLIQTERPDANVSGAYSFLYPLIGMKAAPKELRFCFTTHPELLPDYTFHGAFRSRLVTAEAFFGLMRLLRFVGHAVPRKALGDEAGRRRSYVFGFRRLPEGWATLFAELFLGRSLVAIEELTLGLLDNAGARAKASEVQEDIDALERFFREEAEVLAKAIAATGFEPYPVPQTERDPLFLRFRAL